MKKRLVFVILILVLLGVGTAIAQERQGHIRPSFSIGYFTGTGDFADGEGLNGISLAIGIDFVHSTGLTLVFHSFHNNELQQYGEHQSMNMIGIGYTHQADRWCAGANFVVSLDDTAFLGLNINGTHWFMDRMGVSGYLNLLTSVEDETSGSVIAFGIGISLRF